MIDRLALRLLLAQLADVATFLAFYLLIGAGTHQERNPLVLGLMALGGLWAVAAAKLGISAWVSWRASRPMGHSRFGAIRRFHERHPRIVQAHLAIRTIGIATATASGVAGAGFNVAAILHGAGLVR